MSIPMRQGKIVSSQDMKCLLLSRYSRLGPSSRVRSYQYLPYLEAHGINVSVAPLLGDTYIRNLYAGRPKNWGAILGSYYRRIKHLLKSRRFDLVWMEHELLPWLPAWGEYLLAFLRIPYLVDYDDAIFHRYDLHQNFLVRASLGHKIDAVMRRATLVIAGNHYLADRACQAGARRVEILPTVVDLDRYHVTRRTNKPMFSVGWIGSPATIHYLASLQPALSKAGAGGKMRMILVGSGPIELPGVVTEIRAWSEDTEVASILDFDVGVMPLPDDPWTRGKCGYKLVQYMACALPVVASPVGMNRQIIKENVSGLLAATEKDWVRALIHLRDNPGLCEAMGRAGRAIVEENYCLRVTAPPLLRLLKEAANRSN